MSEVKSLNKKTFAQIGAEQLASEPTPAPTAAQLGYDPNEYEQESGYQPLDFFYVFGATKKDGSPLNPTQRQLKAGSVVIGTYEGSFQMENKKGIQTIHRVRQTDGKLVGLPGVKRLNTFFQGDGINRPAKTNGTGVCITYLRKGVTKEGNDIHEFTTLVKKSS